MSKAAIHAQKVVLLYEANDDIGVIDTHHLPLDIYGVALTKLNNKQLGYALDELAASDYADAQTLLYDKSKLYLLQRVDSGELLKVHNDWEGLTRRVVSAGRKSELLLQATKAAADMQLIDGTAGFGHDSLILASSGARVLMLERSPVVALMLIAEKQRMRSNKNWQGLLSRLTIRHADLLAISADDLAAFDMMDGADIVYLDPMFPKDSYTAKVGKNMQALHEFIDAPDQATELRLLNQAKTLLNPSGSVIVKRPIRAPYLGQLMPVQSWENEALRFDKYLPDG